jgi:hypothetical protein
MTQWRVEYGAVRPIPEDGAPRTGWLRDADGGRIPARARFHRLEDAWIALLANAEAEHEIRIADLRKAEEDLIRVEQEAAPREGMKLLARRALERCCDMERRSAEVLEGVRRAHTEWLDRRVKPAATRASDGRLRGGVFGP